MAEQPSPVRIGRRHWLTLTWVIFLATATAYLGSLILWAGVGFEIPPVTFYRSSWIVVMQWLLIVVPAIVGLLLGLRLHGSRVALLLGALGLAIALENLADMLVATPGFIGTQAGPIVAWAASTLTFPAAVVLMVLLALVFPTGRPVSSTWASAGWLAAIGCALLIPYQGFAPGTLPWYRDVANPFAVPAGSDAWLVVSRFLGLACIVAALVAAAWSIVVRYRGADEVLRLQLRWFLYGIALLVVTGVAQIVAFVALPADSTLGELTLAALFIGASAPIVAALIAITRYGLYEIDVLINRTFVFGALTAVLAGLYAAGIRFFQVLFVAVTGQESDGALVLTTLVLATTFTPIKLRLEGIAARRYQPAAPPAPAAPSAEPAAPAAPAAPSAEPAASGAHIPPGTFLTEEVLRTFVTDVVREELSRRDKG